MKKKLAILALVALFAVTAMVSCDDRNPDTAVLPTPDIEFNAVESIEGTIAKINIKNMEDTRYEFVYLLDVTYEIQDSAGNTLVTKTIKGTDNIDRNIFYVFVPDTDAGDELTLTVTFDYNGYVMENTATDIVG